MKKGIRHDQIACMNLIYRNFSLDYFLDSSQRIGFESITLWAGAPHYDLNAQGYGDIGSLKRKIANYGLSCDSVTIPALTPMYQYAMEGSEHIENCYRYFRNGIIVAAELGAKVISVNSGYGMNDHSRDEAWERSADLLRRVSECAKEAGAFLSLESLRPPETNLVVTVEDAKKMLRDIGHPNMKAMVDTTAIAVSGETLEEWFEAFGEDIVNMHFVDGTPFGHLAWGDGIFDLDRMVGCLDKYGYSGPLGLEITDKQYANDPAEAMRVSYERLLRYVTD